MLLTLTGDGVARRPVGTMSQNEQETGDLTVVLELPDREALLGLLSTIEASDLPVVTQDIRRPRESIGETAEVDLGVLTDKQRQALELALRNGYYERPRDVDLGTLAEQLDISKSAVSQRLRSAERKLIENALTPLL